MGDIGQGSLMGLVAVDTTQGNLVKAIGRSGCIGTIQGKLRQFRGS